MAKNSAQRDLNEKDMAPQHERSDEDLMVGYQMGEIEAFDILFKRHSGRVLAFLSRKAGSSSAQDLLQEVFFKLHRSRHLYSSHLPFLPWLFSMTRSIYLDHFKKQDCRIRVDESLDPLSLENRTSDMTDNTFETGSIREGGEEMIKALPQEQRQAIGLRIFDESSYEEIAIQLATSPENARKLVSRGLQKLRKIFGKET